MHTIRKLSLFISVGTGNTEDIIGKFLGYEADIGVLGGIPKGRNFEIVRLNSAPIVAFAAKGHMWWNGKIDLHVAIETTSIDLARARIQDSPEA